MPDLTADTVLLEALLDASPDAIIVADHDGTMIRTNPAAGRLFGYTQSEMINQNLGILMPPEEAARHGGYISRLLNTGEKRVIDVGRQVEGMHKDGTVFPLHLSVGRADIDGRIHFVGVLHDLSQRKATEIAMQRSQRMEVIGQLLGGVAHDFNNLLSVITGNLELLEQDLENNDHKEILNEALDAAELGANLVSQLLSFASRGVLAPTRLDVNKLVERTVVLLRRTLKTGIRLQTDFAPDLWPIEADPTQLQTALVNLAVNAQDAMKDGGELIIETSNAIVDDDYIAQEIDVARGKYARISVTDTGHGMPPSAVDRAFEPFFTTKSAGKGTGLGLSMVYGFVKQCGGYTTLYSEVGQGTTISLYLPAQTTGTAQPLPQQIEPQQTIPRGSGQTILVVEDNPSLRRLSLSRLKALGYHVIGASNASDALTVLLQHPEIDLLFTDIIMPGTMTGYDLALQVEQDYPKIRVLITSGFAKDLTENNTLSKNGFELLRKPYRQVDLATQVNAILSR